MAQPAGSDDEETTGGESTGEKSTGEKSTGDETIEKAAGDEPADPQLRQCDYCRLPVSAEPIETDYQGIRYVFCSEACREALEESDSVFATYHGFHQFRPGLAAMDAGLPEGMPRNSFVLLSGQSGTRDEAVQAELVWRTLRRNEPVVIVSFLETPTSVVQEFVGLGWNVLPYLESGQLRVLDCFTYRLEDAAGVVDRMNDFNRHLHRIVTEATTSVSDPTNLTLVRNRLDDCLDELGMNDRGIVVIDSLMELGTLVQPVKAYDFVKRVRADVPKGRFVPVFAGATLSPNQDGFPHDMEYMVDGVVDLRFTENIVPDTLLKQLRIRKMSGVLTIPKWHTYEYTSGRGQVVFDPEEEIERSEAASEEGSDERGDEDTTGADEGADGPGDGTSDPGENRASPAPDDGGSDPVQPELDEETEE